MLTKQQHRLQCHQSRGDVLQKTQGGVRQVARSSVEAQQWQQGDGPRRHQPQRLGTAPEGRLQAAGLRIEQQPDQRDRQQQPGFHHQPWQGGHRRLFADQTIKSKAAGQCQGQPGQAAHLPELLQYAQGCQANGQPLQAAQAFAEQQHAQEHVEQRVDVVTQAGFEHAPVIHRPDIQQPVRGNQQTT